MQTSTVVKRHRVPTYVVLGVIIALIVGACAITQKHGPGVSIHETFVEIYPGTKISSADQKALDAVLKHFKAVALLSGSSKARRSCQHRGRRRNLRFTNDWLAVSRRSYINMASSPRCGSKRTDN